MCRCNTVGYRVILCVCVCVTVMIWCIRVGYRVTFVCVNVMYWCSTIGNRVTLVCVCYSNVLVQYI